MAIDAGLRIVVAGSAAPESLFRRLRRMAPRDPAVGLTETSPIATVSTLKTHMESWPEDDKFRVHATQGIPAPFIEVRSVNEHGEVAWDGSTPGELEVRGPFVADEY